MNVKVQANFDGQLCSTCAHSTVVVGDGIEYIKCNFLDVLIRHRITRCSEYRHRAETSLTDFRALAWILRTDGKYDEIGFKPPKKGQEHEYDPLIDDKKTW
jgi:hypothetical protein